MVAGEADCSGFAEACCVAVFGCPSVSTLGSFFVGVACGGWVLATGPLAAASEAVSMTQRPAPRAVAARFIARNLITPLVAPQGFSGRKYAQNIRLRRLPSRLGDGCASWQREIGAIARESSPATGVKLELDAKSSHTARREYARTARRCVQCRRKRRNAGKECHRRLNLHQPGSGWSRSRRLHHAGRDLDGHSSLSNCLLYTSPSPRDRTRSRMPSSA